MAVTLQQREFALALCTERMLRLAEDYVEQRLRGVDISDNLMHCEHQVVVAERKLVRTRKRLAKSVI